MQKCGGAGICKNEWPRRWKVQQPSLQRCVITVKGARASRKEPRPQKITWQRCLPGGTRPAVDEGPELEGGSRHRDPGGVGKGPRAGSGHQWGGRADIFAWCPLRAALPCRSHHPWPFLPETITHRIHSLLLPLSLLPSPFQGRALAQLQLSHQDPQDGKWGFQNVSENRKTSWKDGWWHRTV